MTWNESWNERQRTTSATRASRAFSRGIGAGSALGVADPSVAPYFGELVHLILGAVVELDFGQPWHRAGPAFGDPRLAPYRLGQRSFQAVVLDAYHRRCAISGTHIPPVLQAAHIRPVTKGGEHRLDNGLLLRSDIHTLFDRGYLSIDLRLLVDLLAPRASVRLSAGSCNTRVARTAIASRWPVWEQPRASS